MPSSATRRIRAALTSNASDAGGNQTFDITLDIVAVGVLGFTATQMGLLNALGSLSFLLLAVPIGMLVDRVGAPRMLATFLLMKLCLCGLLLAFVAADVLTVTTTMIVVTAMGVLTVGSENAQTTIVPQLTTQPDRITRVVATMASADKIAGVIVPGVMGVVVAAWGGVPALTAALAMFALAAVAALPLVRGTSADAPASEVADPPTAGATGGTGLLLSAAHGFVVMARNRFLLATTLLVVAGNIGLAIGDALLTVLILRTLDLGAGFFGLLGTIAAASGLIAAMIAPRVTAALSLRLVFGGGAIAQALAATLPLLTLLWPGAAHVLLVAYTILWAVILTITNIAGAAYTASVVPKESLGRTSAARRTLTMGCVPIAALSGGVLADTLGMWAPLLLWPALTFIAAAWYFALTRRGR